MWTWLLAIPALAALGYLIALHWVFLYQRKLQYRPSHRDASGAGNDTFRPWRSADAFLGYVRPVEEPRRAVLFFHGNGGEALDREWMDELVPRQVLLLLAEYPGFGARPGAISESELLRASEALFEEIRRTWGDIPVTVVGESLGSAVACYVAARKKADRLALISPFPSAVDVVSRRYPYFPLRWILKDKFPAAQYVRGAGVPLYVLHGTLDQVIPMELGRKLYSAYDGPKKEFTEIPGFGHNQMDFAVLHSPFAEGFRAFIEK
jgi:pimeloyl-ACP methyl ester carboxylesterase